MMNIILVGFMGTGKSMVGRRLADNLQFSFLDTDDSIIRLAGKSISDIFSQDGEGVFRTWETRVLKQFVEAGMTRQVIATGGGIVLAEQNWSLMRKLGCVVCLTAEPDVVLKRVGTASDRPLLAGTQAEVIQRIRALLAQRQSAYAKADWTCDTGPLDIHEAAEAIKIYYEKNLGRKGLDETVC
ncbi:shikimate kinase [bacterium]|nr:shikimate kinase [bacterium]